MTTLSATATAGLLVGLIANAATPVKRRPVHAIQVKDTASGRAGVALAPSHNPTRPPRFRT